MVQYVTGRLLTLCDMPQAVYEAHFAGKNWDNFEVTQQLVIEGDTACLALY